MQNSHVTLAAIMFIRANVWDVSVIYIVTVQRLNKENLTGK